MCDVCSALARQVLMAALTAGSVLAACCWLLPLAASTRRARHLAYCGLCVTALTLALVVLTPLGTPYSEERPQRLMVFHARVTPHSRPDAIAAPGGRTEPENLYWVPQLDANTFTTVSKLFPEMSWWRSGGAECGQRAYCGAPYHLPARSLVPAGAWLRPHQALGAPLAAVSSVVHVAALNGTTQLLHLNVTGPSHIVVVVTCVEGVSVTWAEGGGAGSVAPVPARAVVGDDPARQTYFFSLFDAAPQPRQWDLKLYLQRGGRPVPEGWAQLLVSGHSMWGEDKLAPQHAALLRALPPWTAPTGWGVDVHLYDV